MIKELWRFAVWQLQGLERWQYWFIFAMTIQIVGWLIPGSWGWALAFLGMSIVLAHILKWFVWDRIKDNWHKYRAERNELLTTIKNSEDERSRQI
jgi:hypothetical protein